MRPVATSARTGGNVRQSTEGGGRLMTRHNRYWKLGSRFLGVSALATGIGQLVFLTSYALGAIPVLAAGLSWLAGAVPNFLLNRRNWGNHGHSGLRGQILRFGIISVSTALLAALVTSKADILAQSSFPDSRTTQILIVWGTFLGTYVVLYAIKFVLYDRVVFTAHRRQEQAR